MHLRERAVSSKRRHDGSMIIIRLDGLRRNNDNNNGIASYQRLDDDVNSDTLDAFESKGIRMNGFCAVRGLCCRLV